MSFTKNSFSKVEKSGEPYVEIEVSRGIDLPKRDITGKSDPYIIFKFGNEKATTGIKYQTLNPIWNERLALPIALDVLKDKGILEVNVIIRYFLTIYRFGIGIL
jgi:Ca2+-dependent lipid-binding protein